MKIFYYDAGHMTKMTAMRIYGKYSLKSFSPGTSWPSSMKLGMKYRGIKFIIVNQMVILS